MKLKVDLEELKPLVEAVVGEVLRLREEEQQVLPPTPLAYREDQAAALLNLRPHQLRDERLRGRLSYSRGPGNKVLYSREDLLEYLRQRRTMGNCGERENRE